MHENKGLSYQCHLMLKAKHVWKNKVSMSNSRDHKEARNGEVITMCVYHARFRQGTNKAAHSGFEIQRRGHQKSKTGGISGPTN